jgi:methionyl-tRNA formyltransferase
MHCSYDEIVFLGGGELLRKLVLWSKKLNISIKVVSSQRHSLEEYDGILLKEFLMEEKVEHIITNDISSKIVKEFIGKNNNSFFLSLGAAWIFKTDIISSLFNNKLFNLHGTRLPQNRGGGGFSWQILSANRFGFCTLHLVDGGVDMGDIVCSDEFLYPPSCRIPSDYQAIYLEKNFNFIKKFITRNDKELELTKQSENFSSYWPRLNTDINGWIDWGMNAIEIDRFICAFDNPYNGARTLLNSQSVRVKGVSITQQDNVFHSYQTGIIYRKSKQWLCVCLKEYTLIIEDIRNDKGENIFDLVSVGDRMHTPVEKIELSKQRIFYTPDGVKK